MDRWVRHFPRRGPILLGMLVGAWLLGLVWGQEDSRRNHLARSDEGALRVEPGIVHGGGETPRLLPVPSEALVPSPLHQRGPRSPRSRFGPSALPPIEPAPPRDNAPIAAAAQASDDPPPAVLRPLLSLPGRRSWTLELAARRADAHTQQGFELADRGAYLSARSEFLRALHLLAKTLDADRRTAEHGRALAAGLAALGSQSSCAYAQEGLALAVGDELAGSMALYGLGKLHGAMARHGGKTIPGGEALAVTFYRASLTVCPRNYMASNDLGVFLAESGRLGDARVVLEQSLAVRLHPAGWKNLQAVDRRLGHDGAAACSANRDAGGPPGDWSGLGGWEAARAVFWEAYVQGESASHAQIPRPAEDRLHVPGEGVPPTDEPAELTFRQRIFGTLPLSSRAQLWRLSTL